VSAGALRTLHRRHHPTLPHHTQTPTPPHPAPNPQPQETNCSTYLEFARCSFPSDPAEASRLGVSIDDAAYRGDSAQDHELCLFMRTGDGVAGGREVCNNYNQNMAPDQVGRGGG
jgi:hypothetical protein